MVSDVQTIPSGLFPLKAMSLNLEDVMLRYPLFSTTAFAFPDML